MSGFIRVSAAQRTYFGGAMSLRWWYKQIEEGRLPHHRAGGAVLLVPADVEAFVASTYRETKGPEPVLEPADVPKPKSNGRGLRFFTH